MEYGTQMLWWMISQRCCDLGLPLQSADQLSVLLWFQFAVDQKVDDLYPCFFLQIAVHLNPPVFIIRYLLALLPFC